MSVSYIVHTALQSSDFMAALDQLVAIIVTGVADIKSAYADDGEHALSSLDSPFMPIPSAQRSQQAAELVAMAANHLLALIRHPAVVVGNAMYGVCEVQ